MEIFERRFGEEEKRENSCRTEDRETEKCKIFGILHFGNFVKARLFMIILVILIY